MSGLGFRESKELREFLCTGRHNDKEGIDRCMLEYMLITYSDNLASAMNT